MSIVAGDIVVNLSIDDKDFRVRVANGGSILRQFRGQLDATTKSVKRMEQQHFSLSRRFRDLVLTLGNLRFVAMDVHDIFLRLPMAILRTAGELERIQMLMRGLSKDATAAGRDLEAATNFDYVIDKAKNAPFAITALSDAFVKLKVAGLDPTKGSLNALVDSVAKFGGTSETLKRASVAVQQMSGKGVISMEELRQQLGEAVPDAMRLMADSMRVSMGELTKMVSKGTLGAKVALQKMFLQMEVVNGGAAAKMMNTWVGATARLETAMALAAKHVNDAGFGDAAKSVIDDLIDGLNSPEFKRFGIAFADSMVEAVRLTKEIAAWVYKYADALKIAGAALIAYKVHSSLLTPALAALRMKFAEGVASYAASGDAALKLASREREASIARQATWTKDLAEKRRVNEVLLNEHRALLTKTEAQMAAHAQRMNGYKANIDAMRSMPTGGAGGRQNLLASSLDDMRYRQLGLLAKEKQAWDRLANAQGASKREIAALTTRHAALNALVASGNRDLARMEKATVAVTRAQRAMAGATAAANGALSLLGGWVGVVSIALMAGITWWMKYGDAAEHEAGRARRAQLGLSDKEDLKGAEDAEAAAKKRYEAHKAYNDRLRELERERGRPGASRPNQALEDKLLQEWKDTQTKAASVRRAFSESQANEERDVILKSVKRVTDAVNASSQDRVIAIKAAFDKESEGMLESSAQYRKLANATQTALEQEYDRRIAKNVAAHKGAERKLGELIAAAAGGDHAGESAQLKGQRLALESITQEGKALQEQREKAVAIFASVPEITGDDKDGKGRNGPTPFQVLMNSLTADLVELDIQASSFDATTGKIDRNIAAVARLKQEFASGKYTETGKNARPGPTQAQQNEALDMLRKAEDMDEALAAIQRVITQSKTVGEDYKKAMRVFANPLADDGEATKVEGIDKLLAKLNVDWDMLAKSVGKTKEDFFALVDKTREQAATIDLAKPMRELVSENNRLSLELITDDDERVRRQMENETALFRAKMQNLIDIGIREKADGHAILTLQEEMNRGLVLRQALLAQKMRTPMELLEEQWSNTTRTMKEATASWAQGTVEAFIRTAETGKFQFGSLVKQILLDIARMQLQKAMTGGATKFIEMAGNLVMQYFTGGASAGVNYSLGGGTGGSTGGFDYSLGGGSGQGLNVNGFAKGGIMTEFGPMALRKYAAGGIARSPQVAIYGEGDDNEAFVPLPDGRSIPVSMKGGNKPNVTINLINQTGSPAKAEQKGQPRFDGKQMILDVVLSAAATPGSFRDGMKNSLG